MRIYPPHLPSVENEPTYNDFRVVDVDDCRGQGVVVLRDYHVGDLLFRMNGVVTSEMTQHSLQIGPDLHLDDPWFAGKTLHSCDPNSRLDPISRLYYCVRDIRAGELLTMDYDETEDILFRNFECRCGAADCRGMVAGRLASYANASVVSL